MLTVKWLASSVCLLFLDLVSYIPYFSSYQRLSLYAQHVYMYEKHRTDDHVTSLIFTLDHDTASSLCNNLVVVECNLTSDTCTVVPAQNSHLPVVYNTTKVKSRTYDDVRVTVFLNNGKALAECYGELYSDMIGQEFSVLTIENLKKNTSETLTVKTENASDIDMFATAGNKVKIVIVNFNQFQETDTVIYSLDELPSTDVQGEQFI